MSEDLVKIEVDGKVLEASKGTMLIEVTDAAGIRIPRFCYHKKLSVAANCRMCLVEVERAPKPLPACATPVMDGMKVYTDSPKAIAAQKGTMEFLLINHPLDCPICDQGGECELQDVAMGYGNSVSVFTERKRVVKDKNIGPLIKTDMTRCIHCTRCVRFGEEIGNLPEMGATGRGEHMEIGTYVEKALSSELSGNVIDLCPVGALTAKPSRYSGRSWEYVQHAGISPHDSMGSNLYLHTLRGKIMRVVPRENEAVNEVWLADRDRFSYEGIYSDDRALQPLVKQTNGLQAMEWNTALEASVDGLKTVIEQHGTDAVGVLVSPNATLEEMYLIQKLARGLGITHIDHRLRQSDFSDQDYAPVYPWLGIPLADMEKLDAALLIGSNIRTEQPIAAHRLRKADAKISLINPRNIEFHFPITRQTIIDPAGMIETLAGVAKAVSDAQQEKLPQNLKKLAGRKKPAATANAIADDLISNDASAVMLGNFALAHPSFAQLRALAIFIARASDSALVYLPEAANSVGGWLAGAVPHRQAGGKPADKSGLDTRAMLETPRKAYILLGLEPELDCWDPATAQTALKQAELVISITAYASDITKHYAGVVLPAAAFGETAGSYINAEGRCQSFQGAAKPLGAARPAWKILRVLGNQFALPGFEYAAADEVLDEVLEQCQDVEPDNLIGHNEDFAAYESSGLQRITDVPIYAADPLVRRAKALQQTHWADTAYLRLNRAMAQQLGLLDAKNATVRQNGAETVLSVIFDEDIPQGCAWIPTGLEETRQLGPGIGPIEISAA